MEKLKNSHKGVCCAKFSHNNTSDIQIRKISDFLMDVSFKKRCKCFRKI